MEQIRRIMRPTDVPDQGLLCDLLWSDPDKVSSLYKKQVIRTNNHANTISLSLLYHTKTKTSIFVQWGHTALVSHIVCMCVCALHDER